ncbi:ribosome assembly RNA-binding protein YhbY [Hyalangium minutum]|uniref:RNA binding protein n=1 Tax=Hyalangium minutum TaxID=394096 RepID=A0A085WV81_9BACT|nr:ribosome assembly RNA-binding protein YhbY [Hyalangium minutum]KFE71594.1 RNA binding protein [Hyalangium minutum]
MPLNGKQRRALRAKGHHLEPVVIVGQSGVTEGLLSAVEQALKDHELIKVKINEGPETRHEAADRLAEGTSSELAQLLGRTALLFKARKKDSAFDDITGHSTQSPREPKPAARRPAARKSGARKSAPRRKSPTR